MKTKSKEKKYKKFKIDMYIQETIDLGRPMVWKYKKHRLGYKYVDLETLKEK